MNILKKGMTAVLALLLVVSMAACGEPVYETEPKETANTEATTPAESTEATEATEATELTEATEATIPAMTDYKSTEPTDPKPTDPEPTDPKPTEPQPTAKPTVYEPADMSGAVPKSERVDSGYFDSVVFVGDSISLKLTNYEASMDVLGKADFITAGSLGSANALWDVNRSDSVHPKYQGQKRLIEDSVALSGKSKVYIMLGMNDIALYGIDKSVSNMETLIGRILAKSPNVKIYVQSMTPITSNSKILKSTGHCPANIDKYNSKLLAMCQSHGWYFLDVESVMKTADGYLIPSYCSDASNLGVHFTSKGCEAWVEYLYTHTAE